MILVSTYLFSFFQLVFIKKRIDIDIIDNTVYDIIVIIFIYMKYLIIIIIIITIIKNDNNNNIITHRVL